MGLPHSIKLHQQELRDKLAVDTAAMAEIGSLTPTETTQHELEQLQETVNLLQERIVEANTGKMINCINTALKEAKALVDKYIPFVTDTEDPAIGTMSAESLATASAENLLTLEQTQSLVSYLIDEQELYQPQINMDMTTPTGKLNNIIHLKNVIEDYLDWTQFNESLTVQQRAYFENAKDLAISYITENGSPSAEADYLTALSNTFSSPPLSS